MANVNSGLAPGTRIGGYRIDAFVARGGMGVIYRATQLELERTVALKLVAPELAHDEDFRRRFKSEARMAAGIDHPNILPVYEAGEINGQLFLAMRYVVGVNLDTLIRQKHALPPERAVPIVAQVAAALDAAHSHGLVHRDVKPANILIGEEYGEERAYLTDFGLSKSSATGAHLTKTGYVVGTLDYVAPEQVQGGTVDGRADTYALACVLFRSVTGVIPFDRAGDVAKMWAHLNEPAPSARSVSAAVPEALDEVIRRGMAKRPEERYASCRDFARAAAQAIAATAPAAASRANDLTELGRPRLDPVPPARPAAAQPPAPPPPQTPPPSQPPAPPPPQPPTPPLPAPGAASAPQPPAPHGDALSQWPPAASLPPSRGQPKKRRTALYAGVVVAVLVIGAVVAIVVSSSGGKKSPAPAPPVSSVVSTHTGPPITTLNGSTTSTTTTNPAAAQAAAYHAAVTKVVPRLRAVFNQFPNGHDFGKAKFNAACLKVAAGLRGIADNLNALNPPSSLLVAHESLVANLTEMETAFRSLANDSVNRDFSGAQRDLNLVRVALAKINTRVKQVLGKGAPTA